MIDNRSVVLSREPEASPSPTGKEETQEAEYRRLAEVTVQLQALYQATTAIHSSLDLPKIFTQITDGLVKLMGYNTALIMMLDDEEGRFQLKAVSTRRQLLPQINKVLGFPLKNLSFSWEEAHQSSALRSVLEGRVAVAKTLAEVAHPIINRNVCSILQQMAGTKTYLVLPLQVGGEVIGGILTTTSREEIPKEELKLLEGFSEAAAQAIKNARLVEQLRQTERELREGEARYRTIVETALEGICIADPEEKITFVNKGFAQMLGFSPEELIGQTVQMLVSEEDWKKVRQETKKRRRGETSRYELTLLGKGGIARSVIVSAAPLFGVDGEYLGSIGIFTDITELRQAEQALRESEEKYRNLVERANDAIVIIQDGLIKYVNPAVAKMWGGSVEDMLNNRFIDYVHPTELPQVLGRYQRRLAGEEVPSRYETVLLRKDGSKLYAEIDAGVIPYEGKPADFVIIRDVTERKQAEEKIRLQQAYFQQLFEASPDAIALLDEADRVVNVNRAFEELFGYQIEEIKGRGINELIVPEDRHEEASHLSQLSLQGRAVRKETVRKRKDGRLVDVSIVGYPVRFDNQTVGVYAIYRDITERKQAEEALRRSEEKYRTLVENADIGICRVTPGAEGRHLEVNPAMSRMLGYSREELLEKSIAEMYLDPADRKRVSDEICARGSFKGKINLRRKDGTPIVVYLTGTAVRDEKGEVKYIDTILEDITERKQAQEELQRRQEQLQRILDSSGESIVFIDLKGIIIETNQRTAEMFGYTSREELRGKNALELIAPRDHERIKANMARVIKQGITLRNVEYAGHRVDGSEFPIELTTAVLRDASGKPIGHVSIASDITERRQAERREKELQRELNLSSRLAAVGELASGVAHEINNPLTAVIGFSELLMSRDVPPEIKQDLRIINENAQRVARIVKNLLTFARQSKPGREYVDINSLVTQVLELRAYQMQNNNIEVSTQLAPELPRTMADPGQLQQVFLNIVINAEQAMRETQNKRRLLVKTERVGNFIRVSFKDTGPGIPPENLDKIFDPFFTTKEVGEGTGLGLSISYGVIKEHGGRIYAKSKPGQGATFVVELPIVAEAEQAEPVEPSEKEPGKVTGAKIMVVDDEAGVRQFLSRALTQEGHKVETINDAKIALERLKRERYHLILLDIKMPGMDGFDFYRQIGKIAPSLQRRTVFITGDTLTPNTWDFLNRTKARYISKPFKLEQLKKDINRILSENGAGGP